MWQSLAWCCTLVKKKRFLALCLGVLLAVGLVVVVWFAMVVVVEPRVVWDAVHVNIRDDGLVVPCCCRRGWEDTSCNAALH